LYNEDATWRQKLITKEKGLITDAVAQCYLHQYYTEQHYKSTGVGTYLRGGNGQNPPWT